MMTPVKPSPHADAFRAFAADKLRDHLRQIERCCTLLDDAQLWFRPNAHSNSVGNLLLHLRGNVSQWILEALGGRPYERRRQAEFDERGPLPRGETLPPLRAAVESAADIITGLDDARLAAPVRIQGYAVTGLAAVFHVVEHFSFHTGQIVTTTKWMLDVDLSLYDAAGRRIDGRSESTP